MGVRDWLRDNRARCTLCKSTIDKAVPIIIFTRHRDEQITRTNFSAIKSDTVDVEMP